MRFLTEFFHRNREPQHTKERERIIRKDEPFTFFDDGVETADSTFQINPLEEEGHLLGFAQKSSVTTISREEHSQRLIVFEIQKGLPNPYHTSPLKGEPWLNSVIYTTLPDGQQWASSGRTADDDQLRHIIFDQWFNTKTTGPTKNDVISHAKISQGSPLPVGETDLQRVQFEIK